MAPSLRAFDQSISFHTECFCPQLQLFRVRELFPFDRYAFNLVLKRQEFLVLCLDSVNSIAEYFLGKALSEFIKIVLKLNLFFE